MSIRTSNRVRPLLLALSAVLLSSASLSASATTNVSVSVVNGRVVLSPDPLQVGDGHNVLLTWTVVTPGWAFAEDAVVIDGNDGEFDDLEVSSDRKVAHETDKDDNAQSYKYSVSLTDGTNTITADPAIQNGGHP